MKLDLVGRLDNGRVVLETTPSKPFRFTIGRQEAFPRLEAEVRKLNPGEDATVKLSGAEAFGAYDRAKIIEIEKSSLPGAERVRVGDVVTLNADIDMPVKGRVVALSDTTAKVDTNHPLAGEAVTFDLKLLDVA